MVTQCCVYNCKNRVSKRKRSDHEYVTPDEATTERKKISFYRFPKANGNCSKKSQLLQKQQREAWLAALNLRGLKMKDLDSRRICSIHFIHGKPANWRNSTHPDWKPQLNLGDSRQRSSIHRQIQRYIRARQRDESKSHMNDPVEGLSRAHHTNDEGDISTMTAATDDTDVTSDLSAAEVSIGSVNNEHEDCNEDTRTENCVQTELTMTLIAAMESELQRRAEEIYELREELRRLSLKEESFVNDDKKVKFFTGLPSLALFSLILSQMNSALDTIKIRKLDNFQKLLLTLMKLRFNTTFLGLSYRFGIRTQAVSHCFTNVVVMLEYAFRPLINWPDRECLRTVVPRDFLEKFGNRIVAIIDCFEIRTDRPSNTKARAESFSNYKHAYTAKYFIVCTPTGDISFISDGYTGRVSDKYVTEHCGFLDNLLPGDIVLADRGFTVNEEVSMRYAQLITPNFTRNLSQLPPAAVERTRKIASVRIHIERVIGQARTKYRVLKGPVPLNFLKYKQDNRCLLDYVVRTACILTNMCDSVVPLESPKRLNENVVVLKDNNSIENFLYCD